MVRHAAATLCVWVFTGSAFAQSPGPLESVPLADYVQRWPSLKACTELVTAIDRRSARSCTTAAIHDGTAVPGAYNLLAQLLREEGDLDAAAAAIARALEREPNSDLHHFQSGQIAVARILGSSNPLTRMRWSSAAYAAFERAHALNPGQYLYRRYVALHKLAAPGFAGGDKPAALALANEGITLGCAQCYMLRGYVNLVLERTQEGFADFEHAMQSGGCDSELLARAADAAIDLKDWARAERYYQFLSGQDPAHARWQVALGNLYVKQRDTAKAVAAFEAALRLDPDSSVAAQQLAMLKGK